MSINLRVGDELDDYDRGVEIYSAKMEQGFEFFFFWFLAFVKF